MSDKHFSSMRVEYDWYGDTLDTTSVLYNTDGEVERVNIRREFLEDNDL